MRKLSIVFVVALSIGVAVSPDEVFSKSIVSSSGVLKLASTVSSILKVGINLDDELTFDARFDFEPSGLVKETLSFRISKRTLNLSGDMSFNHDGMSKATAKGSWSLADYLQFSGKLSASSRGVKDALLSWREALTGFNLFLNTFWKNNGFHDLALGGSKAFKMYALKGELQNLISSKPRLGISAASQKLPINISGNGNLNADGFHLASVGLHYAYGDIRSEFTSAFNDGPTAFLLKLQNHGEYLDLEGVATWTEEKLKKLTLNFVNEDSSGRRTKGFFTFGLQGLQAGRVEGKVALVEDVLLAFKIQLDDEGFQHSVLTAHKKLYERANVQSSLQFDAAGISGGSLRLSLPWEDFSFSSTTTVDRNGFQSQQFTISKTYPLEF